MKRVQFEAALLVAVSAMLFMLTRPAAGQQPDAVDDLIVVGNADAIRTETVVSNSSLNGVLAGAATRVAVEFANAVHFPDFAPPPAGLSTALSQVATRIPVEFANAARHFVLTAPPAPLTANLGAVTSRIAMEFANANRSVVLSYPLQLVKDTSAPVINTPSRSGTKVTWTTNEFTRTVFRYGTSPSQLTQELVDSNYAKTHEVTLPALGPGVTYYYQITATDLSGNVSNSTIYEVKGEIRLFLPAVRKN